MVTADKLQKHRLKINRNLHVLIFFSCIFLLDQLFQLGSYVRLLIIISAPTISSGIQFSYGNKNVARNKS